jgi:ketosteroid isomerase-like protein
MKSRLVVTALVLAAITASQAQPPNKKKQESLEEKIAQLEIDRQAAFKRGDVEALERSTADDYTSIASSGATSSKARMLERLKSGTFKMQEITLQDLKARVYGKTAVLTGRAHEISTFDGKQKDQQYLFTRVFVKKDGHWQAVSYQQTSAPAN